VRRNLSDRLDALELAVSANQHRWRTVMSETVYADEDEAAADRKSAAAVKADRDATGWQGKYIVLQPTAVHAKDGTYLGPIALRK
jgi:hypothetical protein